MSHSRITAISRALQRWIQPIPSPVEAPAAAVPRGPQPALRIDARLSHLALRTSASMSMAGRNAKLPAMALRGPAAQAVIHPLVQPQPRHSLGSQVWSQWFARQESLGTPWAGPLDRHGTRQLETRFTALQQAVDEQLKAIRANNAEPGARIFDQEGMSRQLSQRLTEAERIKDTLDRRKAPPAPLGAEVWDSARIARKALKTTRPLHLPGLSDDDLHKRRDGLALALNAHNMSSGWFEKGHGQGEIGSELLDKEMAGYRAEIGKIDALLARRTPRK